MTSPGEVVDHYRVLGIQRDASPEDIKRAYKRKTREHPDLGGNANADFHALQTAQRILLDAESRSAHNAELDRDVAVESSEVVEDADVVDGQWGDDASWPSPAGDPASPPTPPPPPPPPPPSQAPPAPPPADTPRPPSPDVTVDIPLYQPGATRPYRQATWAQILIGRTLPQRITGALWVLLVAASVLPGLLTGGGGLSGTTILLYLLAVVGCVRRVRGQAGLYRVICALGLAAAAIFAFAGTMDLETPMRVLAVGSILLWVLLYVAAVQLRSRDPELAS